MTPVLPVLPFVLRESSSSGLQQRRDRAFGAAYNTTLSLAAQRNLGRLGEGIQLPIQLVCIDDRRTRVSVTKRTPEIT